MKAKAIHLIYMTQGYHSVYSWTRCGEHLTLRRHGSTEPEHVTCKRCRAWIEKHKKA